MAGSRNDTHYSTGYNFNPVTASSIQTLSFFTDSTFAINSAGNPEGVWAAPPGSIAMDSSNGALYLKVSGTGNTGWEEIQSGTAVATTYNGDTGSATPAANILQIIGGTNVVTSASGNTVQIDSDGPGVAIWQNIGSNQTLEIRHGYFVTSGALSLALPTASDLGDEIEVVLRGGTSWTITQGAGQQIFIGNQSTTSGAGGSLASTADGDSIRLICQTDDLTWVVTSMVGNITVV